MKRIVPSVIILALPIIIFPMEKALGKMMAEVECKGTEEKLVYDCMITLKDSKSFRVGKQGETAINKDNNISKIIDLHYCQISPNVA